MNKTVYPQTKFGFNNNHWSEYGGDDNINEGFKDSWFFVARRNEDAVVYSGSRTLAWNNSPLSDAWGDDSSWSWIWTWPNGSFPWGDSHPLYWFIF